jgi:hypothetical protein
MMQAGADTIQVPVTTLDRFVSDAGLDRIDLIKVDVEGFELHMLRGAEAVIKQFRPRLFVELSDENLREQGGKAAELVRWLADHGYALENAETGEPVHAGPALDGCFFDVIGLPR